MALTAKQLQAALRIDAPDAAQAAYLTRLQTVAGELVAKYAPDAPEAVTDEAVVMIAGYLYDAPEGARIGAVLKASGAASVLTPWRTHRAGIIGGVT